MADQSSATTDLLARYEAEPVPRRQLSLSQRGARALATCAQGVWLLLAATPVIVVVCALKG